TLAATTVIPAAPMLRRSLSGVADLEANRRPLLARLLLEPPAERGAQPLDEGQADAEIAAQRRRSARLAAGGGPQRKPAFVQYAVPGQAGRETQHALEQHVQDRVQPASRCRQSVRSASRQAEPFAGLQAGPVQAL